MCDGRRVCKRRGRRNGSSINQLCQGCSDGTFSWYWNSFFWGTFRVIAAGIGAPLAKEGNILGLILYLILILAPQTLTRVYGFKIGYSGGRQFLARISADGTLNKLTDAAKILGLTVVGGLIPSIVAFPLDWTVNMSGTELNVQEILDGIMPALIPLLLSFVVYSLLKKKIRAEWILIAVIILAVLLTIAGVM